jgi:hypothetical protein
MSDRSQTHDQAIGSKRGIGLTRKVPGKGGGGERAVWQSENSADF